MMSEHCFFTLQSVGPSADRGPDLMRCWSVIAGRCVRRETPARPGAAITLVKSPPGPDPSASGAVVNGDGHE